MFQTKYSRASSTTIIFKPASTTSQWREKLRYVLLRSRRHLGKEVCICCYMGGLAASGRLPQLAASLGERWAIYICWSEADATKVTGRSRGKYAYNLTSEFATNRVVIR